MVAPHFHTTEEAKAAIKKVEHNSDHSYGPPSGGISGGSAANEETKTKGVSSSKKGDDWA